MTDFFEHFAKPLFCGTDDFGFGPRVHSRHGTNPAMILPKNKCFESHKME
jgi:hypothetical protein